MSIKSSQSDVAEASSSASLTSATNKFFSLSHASNAAHVTPNNNSSNSTLTNLNQCFSCSVCNIDLSNQKNYNSHLNSRQHQQAQSIHDVLQSVSAEYPSAYRTMFSSDILNKKVFNRELRCEEELNETKSPLLGLSYVIEFQFENVSDPAQYVCELCHCKCAKSVLPHIINPQHQRRFLKIHHPDMYERVLSTSNKHSEQHRLIENFAKQIYFRHGNSEQMRLHVQLNSFLGQKPIVLSITCKSQSGQTSKVSIQSISKTFDEYDYPYEDIPIAEDEEIKTEQIVNHHESSIQRGLTQEDLLYPFERQFWHQNYKELIRSRPLDPHAVTYEEVLPEIITRLQPFQGTSDTKYSSSLPKTTNEKHLTLENGQTIRRNTSQPSNRRVILDSNRTPVVTNNGGLQISSTTKTPNFDGYTLLNAQQKISNGTHTLLNEQSARAILAASGLLQSDEEDEQDMRISSKSTVNNRETSRKKSEQTVSPAIAKRMLDAVLNGELDVVHIQPYFSTFVHLIQSGQVELERHQAERLLRKVLVTSSSSTSPPIIKSEPVTNSNKRTRSRSRSHSRERRSAPSSRHYYEEYRSSSGVNSKRYSSPTSTARRVHLRNENKTNGK